MFSIAQATGMDGYEATGIAVKRLRVSPAQKKA